jgi:hypothetical protein
MKNKKTKAVSINRSFPSLSFNSVFKSFDFRFFFFSSLASLASRKNLAILYSLPILEILASELIF